MSGGAPEPTRGAYTAAASALALLAGAAIWLPAFPVGTDLPTHMAFARMVWAPEEFGGLIEVSYPPTAQLFVWLVAPLTALGPATAARIGLTFVALVTAAGAWTVGRSLGDRRPAGLLIGLAATQTFSSAMGFTNFALATGLGLVAIALAVRVFRLPSRGAWVVLGTWMLVVAHAHVMLAGMVGLHIVLLACTWARRFDYRRVATTIAALAPAGLFSVSVAAIARRGYEAEVAVGLSTQRMPWAEVASNIGEASFGGISAAGWAMIVAVGVGLTARAMGPPKQANDERADGDAAIPLMVATAIWSVIYLVVPFHGWGWAYAQPRVLVPLVVFGGAGAGWGRRPTVVLAILTLAGAMHLGSATRESVRLGASVARQVEAFGTEPPGRTMEVVLDPGRARHRTVQPLLHVASYALANGGLSPLMPHYSPMIHSVKSVWEPPPHPPLFVFRALDCEPGPACDAARARLRRRVTVQGARFESVILVGGDAEWAAAMRDAGYAPDADAAWRPNPGGLVVTLNLPPEAASAPIEVRAGYPSDLGWVTGAVRPPGPGATAELRLGPLPAGPVTIDARVAWPNNGLERSVGRAEATIRARALTPVRLGFDATEAPDPAGPP